MGLNFISKTEITGSSVVNTQIDLPVTTGHHEVHFQDFHALGSGGILDISMRKTSDNSLNQTAEAYGVYYFHPISSSTSFTDFGNKASQTMFRITDGMGVKPNVSISAIVRFFNVSESTRSMCTYNVTSSLESGHVQGYQGGAYLPDESHNGFNINTNQTAGMRGTVIVYEVVS
jgi:hypothetical protein